MMHTESPPLENTKAAWGRGDSIEAAIRDAARSSGGALITGPSAEAEAIARRIHRLRVGQGRSFDIVDCSDPDCPRVLDRHDEPEGGTLLLRDVDKLTPGLQATLLGHIGARRRKFIAAAKDCPMQSLDPALFYHLNVVYVALGPAD